MRTFLTIFILFSTFFSAFANEKLEYESIFRKANVLKYNDTDSAQILYKLCLPYFEAQKDTVKIIESKLHLIFCNTGNGNYQKAYDLSWSLMPLIQATKYKQEQIDLNQKLASLYIIFGQYKKANAHLAKAISIAEKLEDKELSIRRVSALYGIKAWLITNESDDFKASEDYLLKGLALNKKLQRKEDPVYLKMQLAELYIRNGNLRKAKELLHPIDQKYKEQNAIHSLLYDHIGQLYMKWGNYERAVNYFEKCITSIEHYNNHKDNIIEVLDSLAVCYHLLGRDDLAFMSAQKSQSLNQELFGNKSSINKELYEIKDRYQEELDHQQLILLEEEQKVLRLKTIIYVSILLLIISILVARAQIRARKLKLIREKEAIEKQQQANELKAKNKELMSNTLQMLERETLLKDIKTQLDPLEFKPDNQKIINSIKASLNANKAKKWEEFDLYFTSVNDSYYKSLKENFPKLSATDLKMCALIKLGLSSKEMADIMGIGSDSVKTSRSRIRKKMELSRDVNLIEFLKNFGE